MENEKDNFSSRRVCHCGGDIHGSDRTPCCPAQGDEDALLFAAGLDRCQEGDSDMRVRTDDRTKLIIALLLLAVNVVEELVS